MNVRSILWLFAGAALMLALASAPVALAQKKKATPPAPPAGTPVLAFSLPLGGQPGSTVEIAPAGTNLANPTAVWTGFDAKVTLPGEKQPKIKIEIPKSTPMGVYGIRIATKAGLTNLRTFVVDELPTVLEEATNRQATPQKVTLPCAIDGKTDAEVGDFFRFTVKAGQRLSFEVISRRLGSVLDPTLTLYGADAKKSLAYDNDAPGCQLDPRLAYTFKEAGDYVIEVKDISLRGGPEFVYRLRIGDFPMVTTPIPMAVKRGTGAKVTFAGPELGAIEPIELDSTPKAADAVSIGVTPRRPGGQAGWPVPIYLSDLEEVVELEPNQIHEKANRLKTPCGVTGRFETSSDLDIYVFAAMKGEKLVFEGQTLDWGSPTSLYMSIRHPKTKAELAKTTPASAYPADQRVEFTAPEDGDFFLEIQHAYLAGGKSESYHFTARPLTPEFELTVNLDKTELSADGVGVLPFVVVRKGYTGPIDVTVEGTTDFEGKVALKAGQTAGVLLVKPKGKLELGAGKIRVVGKATIDGAPVTVFASAKGPINTALAGLMFPPRHFTQQVAVGVKAPAAFQLAFKVDPPDASPGTKVEVTLTATRGPDATEDITVNPPQGLPPAIPAPKIPVIVKGKTEAKFTLDVTAKTAVGDYFVLLSAKSKVLGADVVSDLVAIPLPVGAPFDLELEPALLDAKQGSKIKLKVRATRKANYKGPIALELRNLPPKVTAGKVTIAEGQTSADLEITIAADAAPAEKIAVDVQGTASALANLAGASPTVTLRIAKK